MSETYKIVNFADLLRVPADRRSACLRELQYSLSLLELAFDADEAYRHGVQGFTWIDDGITRSEIIITDGERFLTLEALPATTREGQDP